ncbi:aminotransferase class I/II-fold pyridoxal phosphate-dependent enzyme [Dehalobacterium formicoaceticum]|uniref:Aminotransferase class I/II-fold pyridoxal phosphate-dependent enzyme n=1 Tax=Dehalobacterium formicoaceticum TaxID=51515 RepID=A0ABT1Y2U8_9FIRM|nr:aminotransferase class I/II-fold pyridoxal phosphate-dependent enzyme [Dehalobacterium formicoaceticum]MCR6545189.1 aminotransferase class I/II-fold pyridoxal phosphate-dependent enzyme [Dehalobacterium formicoaceticum]
MSTFMVASHAENKGASPDPIFAVAMAARKAALQVGREKVVNASIGALYDDQEQFATFKTVVDHLKQMAPEELMNYAPIAGIPEFLQASIDVTFQGNMPEGTFARAVATPGGTGGLRHVFKNYLEAGQKVLIPDWHWGNYRNIASEQDRSYDTYSLFDENNQLNVPNIRDKVKATLKEQNHLVLLFNTPGHNPTGYSLTESDWTQVLDLLKECAEDKSKKITLLLDIAYIDYAGKADETRRFFRLFHHLPQNLLVTIAYSMSKSFLVYGLRSGALIGLSSSEEVVNEFAQVNTGSNRGVWSNGTRCAQRLLADVMQNPDLRAAIDAERDASQELLANRAAIFINEAQEIGLKTFPYHSGFFITLPAAAPAASLKKLTEDYIFATGTGQGIRIAICATPTHKIPGIAKKFKEAL